MNMEQIHIIRCAYLDMLGLLQALETERRLEEYFDIDVCRQSVRDMERCFKEELGDLTDEGGYI